MVTLAYFADFAEFILKIWQKCSFIYALSMKVLLLKILRDKIVNFIMYHNVHMNLPQWPDSLDRRVQDYAKRRDLVGFPTARFSTRQIREEVRKLPNYPELLGWSIDEIARRSQSARGEHASLVLNHIKECLIDNAAEMENREHHILEIQVFYPMVLELPFPSGVPVDLFLLNQRFMLQFLAESVEGIAILRYLDFECTPEMFRQTRYSTCWWVSTNFDQTLDNLKILLQLAGY